MAATADPNNIRWKKDTSAYGYRMLEDMGWSEGQGLGRKKSGVTEHIRVTRKIDNGGIGKRMSSMDDAWRESASEFGSVLAKLRDAYGSKGEKTEALSEGPKEKEKMTNATWRRNRGKKHLYNKFVKNKDTTTYNEDDMSAILGGVDDVFAQNAAKAKAKKKAKDLSQDEVTVENDDGLVTRTHTISLKDYFGAKLKAKGMVVKGIGATPEAEPTAPAAAAAAAAMTTDDSAPQAAEDGGDNGSASSPVESGSDGEGDEDEKKKKTKKKKKRKRQSKSTRAKAKKGEDASAAESPKKKKSKRRRKRSRSTAEAEVVDGGDDGDSGDEPPAKRQKKKKKKKKRSKSSKVDDDAMDAVATGATSPASAQSTLAPHSVRDAVEASDNDGEAATGKSKKSKKKKKKKKKSKKASSD